MIVATPDGGTADFPDDMHPDQIRDALRKQFGGGPAKSVAQDIQAKPDYASMSAGDVAKSAVSNIPSSAVEFGKAVAQPFIHPVDTATNIGMIGKGVMQKLGIMSGKDAEPYAEAVGKFIVDRYGSGEAIKKTIAEDPVGMAADVSMVLSGGGGLAARAPGIAGKLGEAVGAVGRAVDPLTAAGAGLNVAGRGAAQALGVTTGVGADAIKTAARAGTEGGEAGKAFRENLTGEAPIEGVVADAKTAVSQLKQERGEIYRKEMAKVGADKTVLNFDDIDDALVKMTNVKTFKGQSLSPSTQDIRSRISLEVRKWKRLPPDEYHTAEGFDALKQKIGDIRDATQYGTPERVVADQAYQAVRKSIIDQVPEYAKIMKGYETASAEIKEIERTLSVNPKSTVDTQIRKLLSSLRDNVNTNYGKRKELVAFLARSGATHLLEKLAGQTLKSPVPRGLGRIIAGGEGAGLAGALMTGNLPLAGAAIGTMAASSPMLVGGAAYGAGAASRFAKPVARGLFQTGRLGSMPLNQ